MNYAFIKEGLEAVVTLLACHLLPSCLSHFMLEEKGDESQPWSRLAHTWARLTRWMALAIVPSRKTSLQTHYKPFIHCLKRKKKRFCQDTSMKTVIPVCCLIGVRSQLLRRMIPTAQDTPNSLTAVSEALSAYFVTICFALIPVTPPFPRYSLRQEDFCRMREGVTAYKLAIWQTDRMMGLKHRRRNFGVPGQINVVRACVQSQGHPRGLHFTPSVSRGEEENFPLPLSLRFQIC